jgi:hypothetical protein
LTIYGRIRVTCVSDLTLGKTMPDEKLVSARAPVEGAGVDPVGTAGDWPSNRVIDHGQGSPTVLRLLAGLRLRRYREHSGMSRDEAGYAIRGSQSKISRMETGRISFKQRDIADLLTMYGVTDKADREALLTLAAQASLPAWWQPYAELVPSWFEPYLGLEEAADVIRCYEVQFVPGLLQTPDYARAVIRLTPGLSEEEIEQRVELRMLRQRILHRASPPKLWVVVDEAALHRPYGEVETLRGQLRHLTAMAELPNITIQVLPFAVGGHSAAGGPISILRLPGAELPDTVYLEQLTTALYPDRPSEIDYYWHVMNRLVTEAARPAETPAILNQICNQL